MQVPGIVYVNGVAATFPLLAGLLARRRLTRARRWILGWSAFTIALNLVALAWALRGQNNHWVGYLTLPIAGGLTLWALSCWQRTALGTLSMRLAVPLLIVTWAALVLRFENTKTFSLVAEPFAGLLIMAAATYTLISRAFAESGDLLKQDWFWISLGMVLYSGLTVALPPTSHWLLARHPELVVKAYEVKSGLETLALLLIARGMLCPIPATPFGGSSSQGFSPSPSSWSASSSRW